MTAIIEPSKRVAAIVEPLLRSGIAKLEAAKASQCPRCFYLYCKPATSTEDAALCMCAADETPEPGYILASVQPLPSTWPTKLFGLWVYSRLGRLPMLSWNPA